MDALIELIFEFVFDVLLEVGYLLLGKILDKINASKRAHKIAKIVVYTIIALLLLALFIVSLIYKKGLFVILVISYLIFILFAYYMKFIYKTVLDRPSGVNVINWIVRICRYAFTIALIIVGYNYLKDDLAKFLLFIGCALAICIYVAMDYYTFGKLKKNKFE